VIPIKLSTKARYGLRVLFDIAQHSKGKPISLSVIAERQRLPLNYLEQIMLELKKAELVVSVRGAYGGYKLNGPLEDITVKKVFDVLEGPIILSDCVVDDCCAKTSYCVTRLLYKEMSDQLNEITANISLKDMIEDKNKLEIRDLVTDL